MNGGKPPRARLGFGCVRLGSVSGGNSWRSDVRLIHAAVDSGVTLFDTADAYGSGISEKLLGRALRTRRDDVEIATKVGYLFAERSLVGRSVRRAALPLVERTRRQSGAESERSLGGGTYASQDFSRAYVRSAVDASLRRLGTDHIDVCQLHGPTEVFDEAAAAMVELIAAGKVRRFGVGAESVASAREWLEVDSLDNVQLPFGLLDPQAAHLVLPSAAQRGVSVWARGTFGGGLFALLDPERGTPTSEPKWPLIRDLGALAARYEVSIFQLAVDYVRSFSGVSAILLGIGSTEHLEANLGMMSAPPLGSEAIEEADGVISEWFDHDART